MNFNHCHDWTFVGLEIDWRLGESVFKMRDTSSHGRTLIARGVLSVNMPRQHPWGPSVSINRMTQSQDERGCVLCIEMQSGDVIECIARSFDFAETSPD
ncbi:conserved hypothetical protein [Burkholderia vietnamiensis G4]|uniref:Uncharacterized protein n=1 Tax=Burkholderia vietnamiensis (strain G4 / LMG 22486) TaxID=269482 RepID=A4JRZ0_BURVG|nr:conserved hypothetical protein [Burkholderia vietnamiensis G4]